MRENPSTTRERVLAAAGLILDEHGVPGLTVRRVAERAECSTIGVYTHFGDKAGLVEAVLVGGFIDLDGTVAPVDTLEDPRARLVAGAHAYRSWALANASRYLVMFTPAVPALGPAPAAERRGAQSLGAHRARVAAAVAAGVLDDRDVDVIAFHLWASVHGSVSLELLGMVAAGADDARSLFDAGVQAMLDGFAPRSPR